MSDTDPVNLTDWPAPEVRARIATNDEQPANCRTMARLASANGWTVWVTYARGTAPVARNSWIPGPVVDSIVLRAYRSGLAVIACWEDGKAKGAYFRTWADWPYLLTHTQARTLLETRP